MTFGEFQDRDVSGDRAAVIAFPSSALRSGRDPLASGGDAHTRAFNTWKDSGGWRI